jgi:hypothetical protein
MVDAEASVDHEMRWVHCRSVVTQVWSARHAVLRRTACTSPVRATVRSTLTLYESGFADVAGYAADRRAWCKAMVC